MSYIFIKKNTFDTNEEVPFLAVSETSINNMNISDTWGKYGQSVSASDVGDSIGLKTDLAVEIAKEKAKEIGLGDDINFSIDSFISSYDYNELYDFLLENLSEGEDYVKYCLTCDGFNYWDGSNYKTITVSCEIGEPSHILIDDESLISELNEAIESSVFVCDGFGTKKYETEKYIVIDNYCQGHFEAYEVYEKEMAD